MESIRVQDYLNKRALVSRQAAHALEEALSQLIITGNATVISIDFLGIDAVSPSFIDELLFVIESALSTTKVDVQEVRFLNAPTAPTAAYAAIARAHEVRLDEAPSREWIFSGNLLKQSV